jgi:type II secretory pathway pseudopilin PulG
MRGRERGFTFLGLMMIISIMGVVLYSVGEVWHLARKREKEQELLFIGAQFRQAIRAYYENAPASHRMQRYPTHLEDLLKDPRYPGTHRYLRRFYPDPMRGVAEWGLIRDQKGGIIGVHSLSEDSPLKLAGFRLADADLAGYEKYSSWVFKYVPPQPGKGTAGH